MKEIKIIFSDKYGSDSLIDAVTKFLSKNGMTSFNNSIDYSKKFTVESNNGSYIDFSFDCANTSFTKAIALLQLISTKEDSPFYIQYINGKMKLVVSSMVSIQKCIDFIDNCNIEIL